MAKKYDLVIPVVKEDAIKVIENYEILEQNLEFNKMILMGNEEVEKEVKKHPKMKIEFLNENKLGKNLTYKEIVKHLSL